MSDRTVLYARHRPRGNPLLAGIQLIVWLTFMPSVWRAYVSNIGIGRADFKLFDLSPTQWRSPAVRPILFALAVSPLLATVTFHGLSRLVALAGPANLRFNVGIDVSILVSTTLILALAHSVATAIFVGWGMVTAACTLGVAAVLQQSFAPQLLGLDPAMLSAGGRILALGVTMGTIAHISLQVGDDRAEAAQPVRFDWRKHISSVLGGILASSLLLGVALGLMLAISGGGAAIVFLGSDFHTAGAVTMGLGAGILLVVGLTSVGRATAPSPEWRLTIGLTVLLVVALITWLAVAIPVVFRFVPVGLLTGILFNCMYLFPYELTRRLAGRGAAAMAGAVGSGMLYATAVGIMGGEVVAALFVVASVSGCIGLSFSVWRPVLHYPLALIWNNVLYYCERRSPDRVRWLKYHTAFHDEHQRLRLYGLDNYLIWSAVRDPSGVAVAIDALTFGHQRWAVQSALTELEARRLEQCVTVADIAAAYEQLNIGNSGSTFDVFYDSLQQISRDAAAALNQSFRYHQRLTLRALQRRLELLGHELQRSDHKSAARFYPVTTHWRQVIAREINALEVVAAEHQEIDNPYIFGVPLTADQVVFVGRTDISRRIERQILDKRHPPLFIDGRRRMGKTSLLHNLGRLLPNTIIPLYIDGQGLAGSRTYADLLYSLTWQVRRSAERHRAVSLPDVTRDALTVAPFPAFTEWLQQVERTLAARNDAVGLLMFDEFEALDAILQQPGLDGSVIMNQLRHLIQHRPTFRLLFASSHPLAMFDQWASYLINTQVLHLGYLKEDATRQLIEQPVNDFALHYDPAAAERAYQLTRGHPHLVQLLCYEIVNLKNEQPAERRFKAVTADVDAALVRALVSGRFFFVDIEQNQVDAFESAILRHLARSGGRAPIPLETLQQQFGADVAQALHRLEQHELIAQGDAGYAFRVPMIRAWFAASDG